MVECKMDLDLLFASLADQTRRSILERVSKNPHSISELAESYKQMSFAAVAKHVQVLEKSGLVEKKRQGRQQIITVIPISIKTATSYLQKYEKMWDERFDKLENLLSH